MNAIKRTILRNLLPALLLTQCAFVCRLAAEVGNPANPGEFRVGAAKVDITPQNLTNLNSFGPSFTGVHDPIYARALVMESGGTSVAIVALDLVEVGDTSSVRERIQKELSIPSDHIFLTASHDHDAPRIGSVTTGGLAHPSNPEIEAYTKTTYDKIVAVVKQAKAALQPAKFGIGMGSADVNMNRDEYTARGWGVGYNPNGPSDKTVWVLKFETPADEPIAILFNYAVHSVAMLGSLLLSGDLAGAAEHHIEQHYQDKVVALYTIGPAGDQNPRFWGAMGHSVPSNGNGPNGGAGGGPGGAPQPPNPERIAEAIAAMDAEGYMLGAEVVRVADSIEATTSSVKLAAAQQIVPCPVKKGTNQMSDMHQQQAETMPLNLGMILINNVAIGTVSGEVVTNIYTHLKKASPLSDTMMMTITNDRIGYIADDAAYDTPLFEVNGDPLARGCAENAIVNTITSLIRQHD